MEYPDKLEAYAIVDIQDPFPYTRWTYHGNRGKGKGIMAIYDKKPIIPKEWRKVKKIIKVLVSPIET